MLRKLLTFSVGLVVITISSLIPITAPLSAAQSSAVTPLDKSEPQRQQTAASSQTPNSAPQSGSPNVSVNVNLPTSSQQPAEPSQDTTQRDANAAAWAQVKVGIATAFLTLVLMVCTVVIAGFSVYQGVQLRRTLLITNRPRLVMRPFLVKGIEGGRIGSHLTEGEAYITNIGVLPATLTHFWANWMFTDVLPIENPAMKAIDNSTAPSQVQPGHRGKRSLPTVEVPFDAFRIINNVHDVVKKGFQPPPNYKTVYLYGYIKYEDAIGLRRTYFCYRYDVQQMQFVDESNPHYSYEE